ncbi:MAG TPA: guanylate kinase [Candidatus Paceibacterota bacterium]|nr:guanylate kinase [Candidatus Paceibacterota bacterium]HMO82700.1 guanylate kinase [Candidatus Paceibacterota bacterium]
MLENIKGHLIIVMAPTGSGKGTLIKDALAHFPALETTISCTTRPLRPGETEGKEYYFLSQNEFEQKKVAGDFLEWAVFGQQQYGTLKSEILPRLEAGKIVITEIELQGVEQLHNLVPSEHMTTVYIEAGGWDQLKARALDRAPMTEEELSHRYQRYLIEVMAKDKADVIIDNTHNDFTPAKLAFHQLIIDLQNRVYSN